MVGQAREGTSDKTGLGRTKDDGAVMVKRKSPETLCGAGHLGLTHTETPKSSSCLRHLCLRELLHVLFQGEELPNAHVAGPFSAHAPGLSP